jgi:hypothetical protein
MKIDLTIPNSIRPQIRLDGIKLPNNRQITLKEPRITAILPTYLNDIDNTSYI